MKSSSALDEDRNFSDFTRRNWAWVLCKRPELAERCNKWSEFYTLEWICLLDAQPQFESNAKYYGFDDIL